MKSFIARSLTAVLLFTSLAIAQAGTCFYPDEAPSDDGNQADAEVS
jgi:hypothetical protein